MARLHAAPARGQRALQYASMNKENLPADAALRNSGAKIPPENPALRNSGVILLPDFALQAALRHRVDERPTAILSGAENKLTIYQLNAAARVEGVHAGMSSSQGLARCSHLRLLPRSPSEEAAATEALLECGFSCSPWVEATGEGVCTFELRRPRDERLGYRAITHLARLGLQARVGLASNPDLALLAAHAARPLLAVDDSRAFLARLPISALGPSAPVAQILRKWGIKTLGALSALPQEEVARRLGAEGHTLWERAAGRHERLLRLAAPPVAYEESMDFEYEVETIEPVLFVLRRFLEGLTLRLEAIYRVPSTLDLRLRFEDGQEYRREFRLPAPTANVETLFRVLHTHLENFTAPACVKSLHLAATPVRAPSEQFGLFETALRDPNRFLETIARLQALLGADRAGVVCREDTHRPDAFHLEPPDFLHLPEIDAVPELPAFGLPLRRFRPATPLRLEEGEAFPRHIQTEGISGQVCARRGPYRLAGGWWDQQAWACQEWDVQLAEGPLCRISRQESGWYLEGAYD